ncbi:MAG: hypothetical protein HQK97_01600 [Nitrospirae bacterium]|nr:hypothetical protein [Nitrospirota bacterium]
MRKIYFLSALMVILLAFGQQAHGFTGPGGSGMGGPMMQSPLVAGSDGTAYVASMNTSGLSSGSITSNITAITSSGAKQAISVSGMVKSLVIGKDTSSKDTLVAVTMIAPTTATTTSGPATVLSFISLPFNQSATPVSVTLEGMSMSEPVFVNGYVYVTTTRMTNTTGTQGMTSYLYIIASNGAVAQYSY